MKSAKQNFGLAAAAVMTVGLLGAPASMAAPLGNNAVVKPSADSAPLAQNVHWRGRYYRNYGYYGGPRYYGYGPRYYGYYGRPRYYGYGPSYYGFYGGPRYYNRGWW